MKLASFSVGGKSSYGTIEGDGVIDLGKKLKYPTLLSAIKAGALDEVKKAAAGVAPDHRLSAVKLLLPMPDVETYICVGRNYKAHVAEGNSKLPDFPSTFLRLKRSIVGPDEALVAPKVSGDFDYEGELAFVIGKGGRHIKREDALSHIAAYSILQEGSIRDYQFKHCLIVGKNFFATGSFGPYLVTADEVGDPAKLHMSTRLNGQEVQHTNTDDLIFDIPYIISYFSSFMPLEPGDVISTGTPEGVGFARKPPLWMKAGDTLEVEISKLGILRNKVIAE
jgi:2-keto-4-pentenoate hydratase/2-oxohepta-3-ene-1,7-dioic acid hydratase in catechol pathway